MSSREDRPGDPERPESFAPEPTSASGGHIPPAQDAGFDPLTAPLLSEREAGSREQSPYADRTSVIPSATRTTTTPPAGRYRRTGARRVKRTVRSLDPFTVLKLSLFFYAVFLGLWLVFVAIVYWILQGAGLFDTINKLGGPNGFALWNQFSLSLFFVERWAFLIGLTFLVLGALINVFLSFLYNIASNTVGGLEITFVERDS